MKALSRMFLFALTLALAVMSGTAQAGAKPLSPDASARGTSYADLTAAWLEWTTAVPASINPILDTDGTFAGEGQTGKIWFLTGTTTGGSVARNVTIRLMLNAALAKTKSASTVGRPRSFTFRSPAIVLSQANARSMRGRAC